MGELEGALAEHADDSPGRARRLSCSKNNESSPCRPRPIFQDLGTARPQEASPVDEAAG